MRTQQVVERALATLFVFALSAVPAAAQTGGNAPRPVSVDVVGGVNLATLSLPIGTIFEDAPFDIDASIGRRTGLVGGVLVGVPMGRSAAFETGALLSVRGASMKVTVEGFGTATGAFRMIYLDVPALARLRVVTTPHGPLSLLAGPTIGFRLHARSSASFMGETMTQTFTDGVTAVDVGLTVGGRLEFGRGLADVRYTHGLRNAATETGPDGEAIKHRGVSFMAGWRF
jgi:hypothetical protein